MSDLYQIWTVQLARVRLIKDPDIYPLNTTAKSGEKCFAPTFQNVMNYKEGRLSKEQYTDAYLRKMRDSQVANPGVWKKLLDHTKVAILCYCTPGQFCHRHLFVPIMQKYLEDRGHTVEVKGELNGAQYLPEDQRPKGKVSVEQKIAIFPFYSYKDMLSNHHRDGFTIKGVYFKWNEQFIMYCKAMLFGDKVTAEKILKATTPQACKLLGRDVAPYDDNVWKLKRRGFSFRGCYQKVIEHPDIKEYVLATGNAIIVEAAEHDTTWGVGIAKEDPRIYDMAQWRGANMQGEIWMDVRKRLQEDVVF